MPSAARYRAARLPLAAAAATLWSLGAASALDGDRGPGDQPQSRTAAGVPADPVPPAARAAVPTAPPTGNAASFAVWQRDVMARIMAEARHPGGRCRSDCADGRVVVRFRVDRQGKLLDSKVQESSGSKALNAAALAAVRRAGPFPPLPADSTVTTLEVNSPIRFRR